MYNKEGSSWKLFGSVASVSGSKVLLDLNEADLSNLDVGSYAIVVTGEYGVLGQLESLHAVAANSTQLPKFPSTSHSDNGVNSQAFQAVVKLINSIGLNDGKVYNGIVATPRPEDDVFIAPGSVVKHLLQPEMSSSPGGVIFSFANLDNKEQTSLSVTPEMMFGRHLAILGATGSGKSNTISKLMEEAAEFKSKVVLFDATGEFKTLNKGTKHVHLGYSPNPLPYSSAVTLPYFQLKESDLFAIFRPSGDSQAPKLRAAIKSLKLALIEPSLSLDGLIMKANKTKNQYENAYQKYYALVENQMAEFDISKLTRQIYNECVHPTRSPTEPLIWGDINSTDHASCVAMVNRIQDAVESRHLACIFSPGENASLLDVLDDFMTDSNHQVLCVSLEHLSFAHHAREIIANAVGRHLLELGRDGSFKHHPIVVVLDEAHHFLNERLTGDKADYPLDSFGLIAKEGRKYSLNIALSTQRPRDIPEDVLSQMGTMIVHRLTNDHDRSVVERACGEIDAKAIQQLPILSPGQAILTGVSFPAPLAIRVQKPMFQPQSDGPDYQLFWANSAKSSGKKKAVEKTEVESSKETIHGTEIFTMN